MDKPLIVEVHIIVESNAWTQTINSIIKILQNCDRKEYALIPLYVTYDVEDTEVRICFQIEDPARLERFIVERIRKVKGVYATRARLTLNGEIFPKGVELLTMAKETLYSCHIFINTDPGKDEQVWDSLRRLKEDNQVFPVWIFRDFYEYDRDITLRLTGQNERLIRKYVDMYVGSIEGIKTWRLKFMHSVIQMLDKNELLKIAQNWFNLPRIKQEK